VQQNPKTILIVDDEEDLRDALAFDFKRQGFDVLLAENGQVAYKIIQSKPVTIVLSDVRMAGGDGVELLRNIKSSHSEIPVVLSTGFAEIGIDEAYNIGAHSVLFKPFERKALKETVQVAMQSFEEKINAFVLPESTTLISVELNQDNSESAVKFGKFGMSFYFEKSKIKDKSFLSINYQSSEFGMLNFTAIVKYVVDHENVENKNRIGCEVCQVAGDKRSLFLEHLKNSPVVSTIPS
jgi:DNA-binding response OmpR family regulator